MAFNNVYKGKTVLVTGNTGFKGRDLIPEPHEASESDTKELNEIALGWKI